MSTEFDDHAFNMRRAITHGEDALINIRQALEHALREIERCQARYQAAPLHEKPRVLNHALSTACTWAIVNARIDLAADAQAALHVIAQATPPA